MSDVCVVTKGALGFMRIRKTSATSPGRRAQWRWRAEAKSDRIRELGFSLCEFFSSNFKTCHCACWGLVKYERFVTLVKLQTSRKDKCSFMFLRALWAVFKSASCVSCFMETVACLAELLHCRVELLFAHLAPVRELQTDVESVSHHQRVECDCSHRTRRERFCSFSWWQLNPQESV